MNTSFAGKENLPRGLRDNNPGNIRPNPKYKWQGEVSSENNYCVFDSIENGLRAMAIDLHSKISRGLNTIAKYVPVYAPAGDNNDTGAYIATVSAKSGFDQHEVLRPDFDTLQSLVRAHIYVEVGKTFASYVTREMVNDGVGRAIKSF